jgi:3-phosphoglycerate kinase
MKIIFDSTAKIDTIVLENYGFTHVDTTKVQEFCNAAMSEHETIGGIYWHDSTGTIHSMETSNQTLYGLLYAGIFI